MATTAMALKAKEEDGSVVSETASEPSADMLSREEEAYLADRWRRHQDYKARDRLVYAYEPLAASRAVRLFKRSNLPLEDLRSHATLGLFKAAECFDPGRGARFGTFAEEYIKGELRDYQNSMGYSTRIGTNESDKKVLAKFYDLRLKIEARTGSPLDDDGRREMAGLIGVPFEVVVRVEGRLRRNDVSTSTPVGRGDYGEESGKTFGDTLVDHPDPESKVVASLLRARLRDLLDESIPQIKDPRKRTAIHLLLDEENMDVPSGEVTRKLADAHKITVEHARKLKLSAQRQLRAVLHGNGHTPEDLLIEEG